MGWGEKVRFFSAFCPGRLSMPPFPLLLSSPGRAGEREEGRGETQVVKGDPSSGNGIKEHREREGKKRCMAPTCKWSRRILFIVATVMYASCLPHAAPLVLLSTEVEAMVEN